MRPEDDIVDVETCRHDVTYYKNSVDEIIMNG
jgi:hypothetical protein